MKELSVKWASTIDINDVLNDLKAHISDQTDDSGLSKLPEAIHQEMAEWAIRQVVDFVMKSKPIKDLDLVKYVVNFYTTKRLMFTISDLKNTKLYDKYKRLDVDTGSTWMSKSAKPSTASMPIGHSIGANVRVYQPSDATWLELSSIGMNQQASYPMGFYLYEEKKSTLSVLLKVKFINDPKAMGITMDFLQKTELESIAKKLKTNIKGMTKKKGIIEAIEQSAKEMQSKIYPKRVIYSLVEM